ncbi:hypothetical protein [Winogradskyella costae]|uniref:hypothetical protein n=1 Tax=Winogradskyella costae TaxID=2697008 RepID=UPI0015C7E8AA|nr:hypothetical protein [Winogradskyella costae]
MTKIKTPITNSIVKIPIVIISILIFFRDYNSLIDYFELSGNSNSIIDYLKIIVTTSIFRTSFLMLIPLIGVFLKTKTGWVLMLSFYYLIITLIIYFFIDTNFERDGEILIAFFIVILPITLIGVMNNKDNTEVVYRIKSNELIRMNLASFIIALIQIAMISFLNLTQ